MIKKLHVVANVRMPSKKAYGIQLAKTCDEFIKLGIEVVLVVPHTAAIKELASMREMYKLEHDIPTTVVLGLDWYGRGRFGFFLSSWIFMVSSAVYLLYVRMQHKLEVIYTFDMDTFSYSLLPFIGVPCFSEMHGVKSPTFLAKLFFAHASGIITLNDNVTNELMRTFKLPRERFVIETCGVETSWLLTTISKEEARMQLLLPQEQKIATYTGRFYDWKGLDILPPTFSHLPEVHCYIVGGSEEEFKKATNVTALPPNVHIMGECPSYKVPLWLAAADVLMVPWPKGQDTFHQYRSPMKIYECMALRRPLVAGDDPTITDVVPQGEGLLYQLANPADMAAHIKRAIEGGPEIEQMVSRAYQTASYHSLDKRALRTRAFMEEVIAKQ